MRTYLLFLSLLLSGCSAFNIKEAYQQRSLLAEGRSSKIISYSSTQPVDLDVILKDSDKANEEIRNTKQSMLLAKSEVNCNYFVESIHNQRAATNVMLGTLTTIASTAAAIVSGRAGQNLAGSAAVTSSISNSINQEMYSGILMPAITREILETRKAFQEQIVERQKYKIVDYPYPLAIADAIKYHNLCSIPFALVGLINKAAQAPSSAPDINGAVTMIDKEIDSIKSMLTDQSFSFTTEERRELNKRVLALNNQRSVLRSSFALPFAGTAPSPSQTPATPQVPAPATEIKSTISIPGLE